MTNVIPLPSMTLDSMPDQAIYALRDAEADAIAALTEQIDEHARTYHDLDAEMHRRMGRIRRFDSEAEFFAYLDTKVWPTKGTFTPDPVLLWTTAGVIEARCYQPPRTEPHDRFYEYRDYDTERPLDVVPDGFWRYEIIAEVGDFVEPF